MRIATLGTPNTFETDQIISAAISQGHEAKALTLFDIIFEIKDGVFKATHSEIDLLSYDLFIFRGISSSNLQKSNIYNYLLLAKYLYDNNKIIVDKKLATQSYIASKISYTRAKNGILSPDTVMTFGNKLTDNYLRNAKYPLILKADKGSKGNGIFLVNTYNDAKSIIKENGSKSFLFQEYIPSRYDIRVFVVGNKILGAMRRDAPENDFRSNIAKGGSASIFDLKDKKEICKLAIDACIASNAEIAGVDIMVNEKTNKYYVLEVNRSPQFKGFYDATKINVGLEIIKYCEDIFSNQEKR